MNINPAHLLEPSLLPLFLKREHDQLRWLWTAATSEVLRRRPDKFSHFVKMGMVNIAELVEEVDRTPDEVWAQSTVGQEIAVLRKSDRVELRGMKLAKL